MRRFTVFFLIFLIAECALMAAPASLRIDGEEVYRDNCRRCHIAIHTFSPRMMGTVVHHMQVRATLTRDEEAAVLRYLLETSPSKSVARKQPAVASERTDP